MFIILFTSTVVLGNAYLSLFFSSCQNVTALKQTMAAYSRAVSAIVKVLHLCYAAIAVVYMYTTNQPSQIYSHTVTSDNVSEETHSDKVLSCRLSSNSMCKSTVLLIFK